MEMFNQMKPAKETMNSKAMYVSCIQISSSPPLPDCSSLFITYTLERFPSHAESLPAMGKIVREEKRNEY